MSFQLIKKLLVRIGLSCSVLSLLLSASITLASQKVNVWTIYGQVRIVWSDSENLSARPDIYITESPLEQQVLVRLLDYLSKQKKVEANYHEHYVNPGVSFFQGQRRDWNMATLLIHASKTSTLIAPYLEKIINMAQAEEKMPLEKINILRWNRLLESINMVLNELNIEQVELNVAPFHEEVWFD